MENPIFDIAKNSISPKSKAPKNVGASPAASWRFNSSSLSWHFFQVGFFLKKKNGAEKRGKPSGLTWLSWRGLGPNPLCWRAGPETWFFFPRLLLPQSSLLPQLLDAHEALKMKVCGPSYHSLSQPSNSPIWYGTMWNPLSIFTYQPASIESSPQIYNPSLVTSSAPLLAEWLVPSPAKERSVSFIFKL